MLLEEVESSCTFVYLLFLDSLKICEVVHILYSKLNHVVYLRFFFLKLKKIILIWL